MKKALAILALVASSSAAVAGPHYVEHGVFGDVAEAQEFSNSAATAIASWDEYQARLVTLRAAQAAVAEAELVVLRTREAARNMIGNNGQSIPATKAQADAYVSVYVDPEVSAGIIIYEFEGSNGFSLASQFAGRYQNAVVRAFILSSGFNIDTITLDQFIAEVDSYRVQ